ncbi:alpha/beta hydrolase [Enteractinococcus fodinae]|uniref:Acetyl esterase n=1 Tax=Enteractinococcus fodinae TaxID=684663 RepID=A0ABU2B586_9MICC|nr:alpha/beta hydrolase [Enteractinococcus fodinae]MDR7348421.1 acetyl esterase [Enteractinococcus fodinae]
MPLDSELAETLAAAAKAGAPRLETLGPEKARIQYRSLTFDSIPHGRIVPVASTEYIKVPGGAGELDAKVYRPEGEGPFPTILFIHGGGWVIGDLDTHENTARGLCRGSQAVVVSIDYRLAPEHRFPAGLQDAVEAARWIHTNLSSLGGDERWAVAGDSAGGNLAAVVSEVLTSEHTPPQAQLLIYPSVEIDGSAYPSRSQNARGYSLEVTTMDWFVQSYLGDHDKTDPRVSPLRSQNLATLPPSLIAIAEFDPLRDEGAAFGAALRDAGVFAEVVCYDGMIHGFAGMTHKSEGAKNAAEDIYRRFGDLLRSDISTC